jgi:hypothetical protein
MPGTIGRSIGFISTVMLFEAYLKIIGLPDIIFIKFFRIKDIYKIHYVIKVEKMPYFFSPTWVSKYKSGYYEIANTKSLYLLRK